MKFAGFDWDSGNLSKCLEHGVGLGHIHALFAGDVYIVRDAVVAGERRTLGLAAGPADGYSAFYLARRKGPSGERTLHARQRGKALCRSHFPI